jgi:hypothetical protein
VHYLLVNKTWHEEVEFTVTERAESGLGKTCLSMKYEEGPFYGIFFSVPQQPYSGPRPPHCRGFDITCRHTTFGKTPLHEWSARLRDLYLTVHNIHWRQTAMPQAEFEPTIPASERPQTHALDRSTSGIGLFVTLTLILLTWRIGWAPNNASKWQVGFKLAFKPYPANVDNMVSS